MFFMFWTGTALTEPEAYGVWRERYPRFALFKDEDVLPLLDCDLHRELYKKIRLPACKSDIARLALLREHGGLYVDSHIGPSSGEALAETLSHLAQHDLILFSEGWSPVFNFTNGVLAARRRAPVFDLLIDMAFENLIAHKKRQDETREHVKYHVFELTGSQIMVRTMFEHVDGAWGLKRDYRDKVQFHVMESSGSAGFLPYRYQSYRKPGQHWSERQRVERLFED